MAKVKVVTVHIDEKITKNYNSVSLGIGCTIEIDEGEDYRDVIENYKTQLRVKLETDLMEIAQDL